MLQYYVTGKLTRDIYAPDCRFKDPTTDVKGKDDGGKGDLAYKSIHSPPWSRKDCPGADLSHVT